MVALLKTRLAAATTAAVLAAVPAGAAEFVQNGGFEANTDGQSTVLYSGNTSITGWTNNATYTLLVYPGQGDNTSSTLGGFAIYGPKNGHANGLPDTSPAGGNYIGLDSDASFRGTGLSQTISGLTAGDNYTLTFYFAAGQEVNASGATTEQIQASLGAQTFMTETLNPPQAGFAPWRQETATFTATAATEVLNFLAIGGPTGEPPIALIDGVSLVGAGGVTPAVPEPATLALLLGGVAGLVRLRRRT